MRLRARVGMAAWIALAIPLIASAAHAQKKSSDDKGPTTFYGSISAPADIKSISPEVAFVRLVCRIQPQGDAWDAGVRWSGMSFEATGRTGSTIGAERLNQHDGFEGTLTQYFMATREKPFTQGEVWAYSCVVMLGKGSKLGTIDEWAEAGSDKSKAWTQVMMGSPKVEGTFTLR